MNPRKIMVKMVAASFVLGWLLCQYVWGQVPPKDVGLLTQVTGPVKCVGREGRQEDPQPFMKIRLGDRFVVEEGGSVEIVFFQSSRQELWKGPVKFRIGEAMGEPEGDPQTLPEVRMLPAGAGEGIKKLPELLRRAGLTRSGGMQVRGIPGDGATSGGQAKGALPSQEIDAARAREVYKEMRLRAAPQDITPELCFLGSLAAREDIEEMASVIQEALKRRPQDPILRSLLEWAKSQRENSH